MRNVRLSYGCVTALRNINLSINRAEVHAIVGEHGAGKSSLAHVISGFQKPDSGTLVVGRSVYGHLTPEIARKNGIEVITQHNPLFEDFTVADNIVIDGRIGLVPYITHSGSIRRARKFIEELGVAIDPTVPVRARRHTARGFPPECDVPGGQREVPQAHPAGNRVEAANLLLPRTPSPQEP